MADDITARMRELYEAMNAKDLDAFIGMLAEDFVDHDEFPGLQPGREGVRQMFANMFSAFPDFRMEVDDLFAAGDKGVARMRMTGTHQGEFMGIPGTGRRVDVNGIDIVRFRGGKAVEHWGVTDMLALMQQLGAIPEPAGAPA